MKDRIAKVKISHNSTIIDALRQMDEVKMKLLIVVCDEEFKSLVSIGDIQRALLNGMDTNTPIYGILRDDVVVASERDDVEAIKSKMRIRRNEMMPIIDDDNNIVDVIFWSDLFEDSHKAFKSIDLPVVIMAGGQGTRLRPLTNVLPKPLIPIGEQSMMEDIMDRFISHNCTQFYVSVNYKAKVIKSYFDTIAEKKYDLTYFQEEMPMGTAGSLHLIKDKINTTFFVSNCDIIIDEDYSQILDYHKANKNEITVVAALKNYSIPYGTLETTESGRLSSLHEKPEMVYKINTGMYILEPNLLNEIPHEGVFHITDLINKLCSEDRNVGVFPISEGSWTDVGNWQEYMQRIN